MSPELRAAVAADWLADLREFAAPIVADATQRYRQSPDFRKRPMPGDIRMLCIQIQREAAESRPKPLMIPDQRAMQEAHESLSCRFREAAEAREAWAKAHGKRDFAHAIEVGLAATARAK